MDGAGNIVSWREDLKKPWALVRSGVAELLGTTLLLWLASTTCAQFPGNGGTLQTALTVGTAISTLSGVPRALGHVGGCHMNPAVTMALNILGKISFVRAFIYINLQCLGAIIGSFLYKITTPEALQGMGLCATRTNEDQGVTFWQALFLETILTMVLVLITLAVIDLASPETGPVIIGLTVTAEFLMALQYSGASLNPARSLGPALVSGYTTNLMVYMMGPMVGATGAAYLWKLFLSPQIFTTQQLTTQTIRST